MKGNVDVTMCGTAVGARSSKPSVLGSMPPAPGLLWSTVPSGTASLSIWFCKRLNGDNVLLVARLKRAESESESLLQLCPFTYDQPTLSPTPLQLVDAKAISSTAISTQLAMSGLGWSSIQAAL